VGGWKIEIRKKLFAEARDPLVDSTLAESWDTHHWRKLPA